MEVTPKTSEMINIAIDGNDADIDMPEPGTKLKSKSKSKTARGKKQAAVADFKEMVAEPKVEENHVEPEMPEQPSFQNAVSVESRQEEPISIETNHEAKLEQQVMDLVDEIKEVVKDIVKDVINEDKKEIDVVTLLKKYLCDSSLIKDISFNLDSKTIECFMFILSTYPEEVDGFDKLIKIILDDNRIDIEDLPELVRICSKIYSLVNKTNLSMDYKTIIECTRLILKFVIRVLIFEKKINIDYQNLDGFLKGFDELVDVCLDMLVQSKMLEKGCISFFKKLMCKNK